MVDNGNLNSSTVPLKNATEKNLKGLAFAKKDLLTNLFFKFFKKLFAEGERILEQRTSEFESRKKFLFAEGVRMRYGENLKRSRG